MNIRTYGPPVSDCPDCWHRWKYHGPTGCGAPSCRCSEPDFFDKVRCTDGALVHDFKGQDHCPACGMPSPTLPVQRTDNVR